MNPSVPCGPMLSVVRLVSICSAVRVCGFRQSCVLLCYQASEIRTRVAFVESPCRLQPRPGGFVLRASFMASSLVGQHARTRMLLRYKRIEFFWELLVWELLVARFFFSVGRSAIQFSAVQFEGTCSANFGEGWAHGFFIFYFGWVLPRVGAISGFSPTWRNFEAVAVGQNPWRHFGVGAPPDWEVHGGCPRLGPAFGGRSFRPRRAPISGHKNAVFGGEEAAAGGSSSHWASTSGPRFCLQKARALEETKGRVGSKSFPWRDSWMDGWMAIGWLGWLAGCRLRVSTTFKCQKTSTSCGEPGDEGGWG